MKKTILCRIILITFISTTSLLLLPFMAWADEIIKSGETLTLRRCIETATKIHPDIAAAAGAAQAGRQRIGQAEANYYPQIDLSLGYNKSESDRISSNTSGSFNEFSGSASLRQTIYDFGKTTTQVNIEKFSADSSSSELSNIKQQVIFNVTEAYYGILRAKRQRDVAIEVVKQFEEHLKQAKGFFDVGTKPKFDVTKADVDLSNAKLNLLKADNALRIAKATLNNAMGIPQTYTYEIHDDLSFSDYRIALDDALKSAYDNRADLRALILRKNANSLSIDLAKGHSLHSRSSAVFQPIIR
ncbi:MAG: TolC family protein [Nitrospirae bacterium]|nr:TolC family protein [Nitrospirota bacterium]